MWFATQGLLCWYLPAGIKLTQVSCVSVSKETEVFMKLELAHDFCVILLLNKIRIPFSSGGC